MIRVNQEEVEGVKVAVRGLENRGIAVKNTILNSISYLAEQYTLSKNLEYLIAAVSRIQAYLELGFCYDDNAEINDKILMELGTNRNEQFPKRCYNTERIPLVRSRVRLLLGRWNGSAYSTMKIDQVVDDIICKVREKQTGRYIYHSNDNPKVKHSKYNNDRVFELYVEEDESFLRNVQMNQYYTFEQYQRTGNNMIKIR